MYEWLEERVRYCGNRCFVDIADMQNGFGQNIDAFRESLRNAMLDWFYNSTGATDHLVLRLNMGQSMPPLDVDAVRNEVQYFAQAVAHCFFVAPRSPPSR